MEGSFSDAARAAVAPRRLSKGVSLSARRRKIFQELEVDVSFPPFCTGKLDFPEERQLSFLRSKRCVMSSKYRKGLFGRALVSLKLAPALAPLVERLL